MPHIFDRFGDEYDEKKSSSNKTSQTSAQWKIAVAVGRNAWKEDETRDSHAYSYLLAFRSYQEEN